MAIASRWAGGLVAAAALLSCGSEYLCEKDVEAPAPVVLSGELQTRVTCASGEQMIAPFTGRFSTFTRTFRVDNGVDIVLASEEAEGLVGPNLSLHIRKDLRDGKYWMESGTGVIYLESKDEFSQVRGTASFERSRNLPFIDVLEPEEGPVTSTIILSLELQGTYVYPGSCGEGTFALGPVTLYLQRSSQVEMCYVEWTPGH